MPQYIKILFFFDRRQLNEKQVVPNLDVGHEADEELSISPNGPPNDSDVDSNNEVNCQTEPLPVDDNEEIYFSPDPCVTHPENSPIKSPQQVPSLHHSPVTNFETTSSFPVANGVRNTHTHTVHHVTFSPTDITLGASSDQSGEHHSNHLTVYNHNNINNNNNIIKELPPSVQLPLLRISNGLNISLQHSDTEDEEDEVTKRLRSAFNVQLQQQQQQQLQQLQHDKQVTPPLEPTNQAPSSSGPSGQFNNTDNEFNFSDCNIQVNLRNSSVKPATAFINKISTLSASNSFSGNGNGGSGGGGILRSNPTSTLNTTHPQYYAYPQPPHESSSEDDESVWYEYGCV